MPGDRFIELATSEDRHVLDVLFRHASEAVTVQDRSGIIYANGAAAQLMGLDSGPQATKEAARSVMADLEMIDEEGDPVDVSQLPGRMVLEHGDPVAERVIGYRSRRTNEIRWSQVRASPIKDDDGQVVWAINYFQDITEAVARQRVEQVLEEAKEAFSASLELDDLVGALVGTVVPQISGWAFVHLLDDVGGLQVRAIGHPDTKQARALAGGLERESARSGLWTVQTRVVSTGVPEILSTAEAWESPAEWPEIVRDLGVQSLVCRPLRAGDKILGTLTAARGSYEEPFDSTTLSLIESVADRAGGALAHATLFSHQQEVSRLVLDGLRPSSLPTTEGLEMAAHYRPHAQFSRVGGDFYDVVSLSADRCAIFVGDIEGKGIPAAGPVMAVRHSLRTAAIIDPEPDTVFRHLNDLMLMETPTRLCTLAYVVVDRRDDKAEIEVCLAGHPPPVVVSSDGHTSFVGRPCPPAGVMQSLVPFRDRRTLEKGDTLVLYTDGILGQADDSVEGLRAKLHGRAGSSLEGLLGRLLAAPDFVDGTWRDDVVLLAMRVV